MPVETTSTTYGTLTATRGALVCPAHCGIGEYPSGAADSPGGCVPGCCAGGRGIDAGCCGGVVCACAAHTSADAMSNVGAALRRPITKADVRMTRYLLVVAKNFHASSAADTSVVGGPISPSRNSPRR